MAAALACAKQGGQIALFERATEFSEVGAGVQLGPNAVKILHAWGLQDALNAVAAYPERLQVRSASTGAELGQLRLGAEIKARYGAPWLTIHRADLHGLLLQALAAKPLVSLHLAQTVSQFEASTEGITLHTSTGYVAQGDALVAADGGWSRVRQQLLNDGVPQATGHVAYRAMVLQSSLPEALRSQQVTVWLGPRQHVVQYPVRGGAWLNVVAIVHGRVAGNLEQWDHRANAAELQGHISDRCAPLRALIEAIPTWRLWGLGIRTPMSGAREQAQGRVALLGDAAHPMLPYLAQGAGMAIEDACELARVLEGADAHPLEVPARLSQYAERRWRRNARVQSRAIRNGQVFHASGALRVARDASMRLLGERLLDMPWLYGGTCPSTVNKIDT